MTPQSPAEHDARRANGVINEVGKLGRRKPVDRRGLAPFSHRRLRGAIITDRTAPSRRRLLRNTRHAFDGGQDTGNRSVASAGLNGVPLDNTSRQSSENLPANFLADSSQRRPRLCERIGVTDQPRRGMKRRHDRARDRRQLEAPPSVGLFVSPLFLRKAPCLDPEAEKRGDAGGRCAEPAEHKELGISPAFLIRRRRRPPPAKRPPCKRWGDPGQRQQCGRSNTAQRTKFGVRPFGRSVELVAALARHPRELRRSLDPGLLPRRIARPEGLGRQRNRRPVGQRLVAHLLGEALRQMPIHLKILRQRVRMEKPGAGERIGGRHAVPLRAGHHRRHELPKFIPKPTRFRYLFHQFRAACIGMGRDGAQLVPKNREEIPCAISRVRAGKKLDQFQKLCVSKRAARFLPSRGQIRIWRGAQQQDRRTSGRAFRLKERLQERVGVLLVQKLPVALELVENNQVRRLMAQCRQCQGSPETANEGGRPERLDPARGVAVKRQVEHRTHRYTELNPQRLTKPLPQAGWRHRKLLLGLRNGPVPRAARTKPQDVGVEIASERRIALFEQHLQERPFFLAASGQASLRTRKRGRRGERIDQNRGGRPLLDGDQRKPIRRLDRIL